MKGRAISGLLMIAGAAVLPTAAVGQQQSLKDQLIGTWSLTSWEQAFPGGRKVQRFGTNPKGITIFDESGRVFVMFARPDLPKLAANNPMSPSPDEAKALVAGSIAYYGTYAVDEGAKTITVRIESSTYPNQVGLEQRRSITSLTGDELKFTNLNPTSGGQIFYTMKRMPPRATQ